MARCTRCCCGIARELSVVRVCMAVVALRELGDMERPRLARSPRGRSRRVALFASDSHMLSQERKTGQCVIEILCRALVPSRRGVALIARLREFSGVRIGVAGIAAVELQLRELHRRFRSAWPPMTFRAFDLYVLSGEGEARAIVIEARHGLPSFVAMTGEAILR